MGRASIHLIMMFPTKGTLYKRSLEVGGLRIHARYCGQMNSLYRALKCGSWAYNVGMGQEILTTESGPR